MKNGHHSNCSSSDAELLNLFKKQDAITFDMLYKRYWHPLLHFASQFIEDEDSCEEIVQGLFVHLHNRHKSLNIKSAIRPYLYASLRNRIFNYVRSRSVYQRHLTLASSEVVYVNNDVEQYIDFNELKNRIAHCVKQMPPKLQEVYLLYFYDHCPIKKIAFILGRPIDTVEKQLRKAKSILRKYLLVNKQLILD